MEIDKPTIYSNNIVDKVIPSGIRVSIESLRNSFTCFNKSPNPFTPNIMQRAQLSKSYAFELSSTIPPYVGMFGKGTTGVSVVDLEKGEPVKELSELFDSLEEAIKYVDNFNVQD